MQVLSSSDGKSDGEQVVAKKVSLKPSNMTVEPQPVNTGSKRELSNIATMTLDSLVLGASLPLYDRDADLDIRGAPSAWVLCANRAAKRHMVLHAFCLASADTKLRELSVLREQAQELCDDTGDERGMYWLRCRPPLYINNMVMEQKRFRLNCWSLDVKTRITALAESYGTTARSIVIAYSTKSLLASDVSLRGWRTTLQQNIVNKWEEYVSQEILLIRRLFNLGENC